MVLPMMNPTDIMRQFNIIFSVYADLAMHTDAQQNRSSLLHYNYIVTMTMLDGCLVSLHHEGIATN